MNITEELLVMLKTMVDQVDDDPRAHQFFDPRLIADAKALIVKAGNAK